MAIDWGRVARLAADEAEDPEVGAPRLRLTGAGRNTRVSYMYRDAANYKESADPVLAGALSQGDADRMSRNMWGGDSFIPGQVGLADLQPDPPGADDHPWHEITGLELTDDAPTEDWPAAAELAESVATAEWDDEGRAEELGIPGQEAELEDFDAAGGGGPEPGPKLTAEQVSEVQGEMVRDGAPVRFMVGGRALNIETGRLSP